MLALFTHEMPSLKFQVLTFCGEHRKGQFRIIFKLFVRYLSDKQPYSEIFQVAFINYTEDDTALLRDFVSM
jgi:hypothetical protein